MLLRNALRAFAFAGLLASAGSVLADAASDFIIAAENDRAGQVRDALAKGIDPNTVSTIGEPALVVAARAGSAATVDALIAGKANVNAGSTVGDTAIMAAALSGHLEIV